MTREQTTIRLPAELKEQLQREAERMGYTLKDMIIIIIRQYMDHQQNENHHLISPYQQDHPNSNQ